MDLTFQVICNNAPYSIGLYFHHQSHPQLGVVLLWLHLVILSGVISPVTYWAPTDLGSSSFSVISVSFSYYSWGSQGKKTVMVCLSSPVEHVLSELSTMTHLFLVALHGNIFFFKTEVKLILLLLSHFSRVRLCATPTAAHQALLPLGFSRQEYGSGLPFPSTMHENEKVKVKSFGCVRLLATPWTAAYQTPPSMGFSRQEYWSGVRKLILII